MDEHVLEPLERLVTANERSVELGELHRSDYLAAKAGAKANADEARARIAEQAARNEAG